MMLSTIAFFFLAQVPVTVGGETFYFERIPNLPTHPTYATKDTPKIVNGYRYLADGNGWWIRERQVSQQATPFESAGPADANQWSPVGDALDEVNRLRAMRGMRPFLRDEGLTQAAVSAASFRAMHGISAHTKNDFGFLPSGSRADAAGCNVAAYWSNNWMACCTFENWPYAGAATVHDAHGRPYHHLFVRR